MKLSVILFVVPIEVIPVVSDIFDHCKNGANDMCLLWVFRIAPRWWPGLSIIRGDLREIEERL